jgi:UDP-glucose 4-epimerase
MLIILLTYYKWILVYNEYFTPINKIQLGGIIVKVVVVFGASSNIGQKFIKSLNEKDYFIYATGRRKGFNLGENVTYISGNILSNELFDMLPSDNVYAVVNFAGLQPSIIGLDDVQDHKIIMQNYVDVNIKGVGNILDYCMRVKVDRYLFVSSHRELENYWKNGFYINSNFPVNINFTGDHALYAISKYTSTLIADYYRLNFRFKVFNFRLPMIYAVNNSDRYLSNGKSLVMPYLRVIRSAMKGEELEVWGDPTMKKDYVYIDNVIDIITKALDVHNLTYGNYIVGTGEAVTTENFIKQIAKVFYPPGKEVKIIYKPEKKTYKCAIYDISKEIEELDYRPILLNEMLIRIKQEIEKHNMLEKWGWDDVIAFRNNND